MSQLTQELPEDLRLYWRASNILDYCSSAVRYLAQLAFRNEGRIVSWNDGRCLPKPGQRWPKVLKYGPNRNEFGRNCADTCRNSLRSKSDNLARSGRSCPSSAKCAPKSASLARIGQIWPKVGPN